MRAVQRIPFEERLFDQAHAARLPYGAPQIVEGHSSPEAKCEPMVTSTWGHWGRVCSHGGLLSPHRKRPRIHYTHVNATSPTLWEPQGLVFALKPCCASADVGTIILLFFAILESLNSFH